MTGIITWPFRFLRAGRFVLIAVGALITGAGFWLQTRGAPVGIDPAIDVLRDGMAQILGPQPTVFGMFSKIGGVLGLAGLLGMTLQDLSPRNKASEAETDPANAPEAPAEPSYISATQPGPTTWQERLAAKNAAAARPVTAAKPAGSVLSVLRKLLVGMVIVAFLAVLGAVFLAQGQTGTTAAMTPGHAMIRAHLAAGGVQSATPSAPAFALPALEIPDLGLPPLNAEAAKEWFKTTLASALAGDQKAMILLGSIVAALFALMLVFKIIFAVRRGKSRGRVNMAQMGYN